MRWQIEHWVFCDLQQTLTADQNIQQLEPMVVELLSYFCQNPGRIISRDELVEQVWLGRMITDNAVNRVVTKLRKALADNPKQPKFVATFPKKGYKFIISPVALDEGIEGSAEPILENISKSATAQPKFKGNKLSYLPILVSLVVVFFGLFWMTTSEQSKRQIHPPITQIKALTRGPERESQPRISPDGRFLAYVEFNGQKMRTKIKSLVTSQEIEIKHGEKKSTWVGSLSWNKDGSQVVYLVTTPKTCQYFIRKFEGFSQSKSIKSETPFSEKILSEPKLIYNCSKGSYGKIAFTHDNNRLVFSESEGRNKPFSLFELNLASGDKRRLNQPEIFIGGNSQFDLHPTENKLLISSPDKQQWEGFYSLDLESDQLELLFKQDAYICCGIWDHSGERVVLMGEHPAYQLVSYDLSGKDRQLIYAGGQQIGPPQRHSNGIDYLLTAGGSDMNVLYYQRTFGNEMDQYGLTAQPYQGDQKVANLIANSSVDDRLARFDYQSEKIAYISLASGNEEVWLTDVKGSQPQKLTQFEDHRHYIDLLWSYNGEFLVALALNEIHIINSQNGETYKLNLPQFEIRGVSLKDNQSISFSSKVNNQWRVTHYDLSTSEISYLEPQWRYVRYAYHPEDSWWVDQQENLFVGLSKTPVTGAELGQYDPLVGRIFNLTKLANHWYWQVSSEFGYKLLSRPVTGLKEYDNQLILQNHSHSFDISKQGVLYHQVDRSNRDIFTTVSQ